MILKLLINRKKELVDKVENFCFGLKSYIRDIKIAKRMILTAKVYCKVDIV